MRVRFSLITALALSLITLHQSQSWAETTSQNRGAGASRSGVNLDVASYGMARNCHRFLQPNGQLGEWGRSLEQAMNRVGRSCFFDQANFSAVLCPNWKRMNQERKTQFIAFLFATIAHFESSCDTTAQVQGTNDIADGLLQLEYSQSQRAAAGRSRQFCATKSGVNTQSIKFQMECGASIFSDGYCRRNNVPGQSSWYWQALNRQNRRITTTAQKFPYCR